MTQFEFKVTGEYAGLGKVSHGFLKVLAENLVMARMRVARIAFREARSMELTSVGPLEMKEVR